MSAKRRLSLGASLAATLAVMVGAAAAAGAPPPRDLALLIRYAPSLVLHPREQFVPSPVEPFIAGADLLARAPDGTWVPAPSPLPTTGAAGTYRLDVRGCSPREGTATSSCYEPLNGPPTTYATARRRSGKIVLQYWFFYPYNLWSPIDPPSPQFWQAHEGDWEEASVLLDGRERPLAVGLSRHCGGVRREWSAAPKRGSHPVVYVSVGSHANGFRPGTPALDPKCWPKEAVAVYKAYKVPMVDHAALGRTIRPALVQVSSSSPGWMRFPGTWGEDQFVGFPNTVFRFGAGPAGPAFQDDWRNPVYGPLNWPRG
jgi:Vacuolar protein sorting-associated protein 62